MKTWRVISSLLVASALLVGCNQTATDAGKGSETSKNKELTILEVYQKAEEVNKKSNGMIIQTEGKQTLSLPGAKVDQEFNMKQEISNKPLAIHMDGTFHMMGQKIKTESYMVDNEMYMSLPGQGWLKFKGTSMKDLGLQNDTNTTIKNFSQIFNAFKNEKDVVSMKKENGQYIISFDSSKLKEKNKLIDILNSSIQDLLKNAKLPADTKDSLKMEIKDYKQTLYIDEKTFETKKVDLQQSISMNVDKEEMSVVRNLKMDVLGALQKPITIPEEVKTKAQSMGDLNIDGPKLP